MSHSEPSKSFGIIPNCSEINPKWQVPEKWACSKPNDLSFSNYAWKSWTVIFHESRFLVYSRTFGPIRNNCGWTIHLEKEKSPFSPRKKGSRCFLTAVFGPRLNVVNIETCIKNLFNEQMFARNISFCESWNAKLTQVLTESHRDGISNRCYEMAPSAPRFDWMRDP